MKIKGDNNWQFTSNNYACWHNTFFSFCFILPVMHHFWKYRAGVAVQAAVCLAWSARQNGSCMSVRFVSVCFSLCFNIYPHPDFYVHSTCQSTTTNTQTEPLWSNSLHRCTIVNSNKQGFFFFRGITSSVTVLYLLYEVIKDCADVPLE